LTAFALSSVFVLKGDIFVSFGKYIQEINLYFVNLTQIYSSEISLAFVATCLVLFGDNINTFVRRSVKNYFFVFRILIFIFLCVVGYGLMTVAIHPLIHNLFLKIPRDYSFIFLMVCFICLGVMAERKRIL
tara:strand:+ start:291 stop:683 length:393 start_codon:yes stop_codon:yes gene_type:complete